MTSPTSPKQQTPKDRLRTLHQETAYSSPWPAKTRLLMALWELVYLFLFRWTPKPLFRWRSYLLRLFGARIEGTAFVASSAQIKMPWNLILGNRSCIGSNVQLYNLDFITIGSRATIAQETYLCTGTHQFESPNLPLVVGKINVGADAFVGARAFVNPGINIGPGAVVGACSVVTRDIPPWTISAGNPSRVIGNRQMVRERELTNQNL